MDKFDKVKDKVQLREDIVEWIHDRVQEPNPGFQHLRDDVRLHVETMVPPILRLEEVGTKYEDAVKEQDVKVNSLKKMHEEMVKIQKDKCAGMSSGGKEMFDSRCAALDDWLDKKRSDINGPVEVLWKSVEAVRTEVVNLADQLIMNMAKAKHDSALVEDEVKLMSELEELMNRVSMDVADTKPNRDNTADDELMRAPTLTLGDPDPSAVPLEDAQPHHQPSDFGLTSPAPPGLDALDGQPCDPEDLATPNLDDQATPNQDGQPLDTSTAPDDQPTADGTMRSKSPSEVALENINQLQDGPLKSALMSLCEAAAAKAWAISCVDPTHSFANANAAVPNS